MGRLSQSLERAGYREKIDHRSYADQNNGLQATIHGELRSLNSVDKA